MATRARGAAQSVPVAAQGRSAAEAARDLLFTPPRFLGPPPALCEHGPVATGVPVRVRARVLSVRPIFAFGRRRGGQGLDLEAKLERADGYALTARFFHAGWLRRHLLVGEWYLFEGRSEANRAGVLLHPSFRHLAEGRDSAIPADSAPRVQYRIPEGSSERVHRSAVGRALATVLPGLADPARAADTQGEQSDADFRAAIRALHQPADAADYERGRRVLAAREMLAIAWIMQERRAALRGTLPGQRVDAGLGQAWRCLPAITARILARLPFALSSDQQRALEEILADLRESAPMYRLVQGEVGSGKTALAFAAALTVIADGAQAMILAPTAILAEQIHRVCAGFLAARGVLPAAELQIGLLTGSTPRAARGALLARWRGSAPRLDLLIGTHALLEADVIARRLGLVIIDEQHRFGVAARSGLILAAGARQGFRPDLLLLTATPIPRTLALTAFGDLAVSRLPGRPGRAGVATRTMPLTTAGDLLPLLAQAHAAGGQVILVCPRRSNDADTDEGAAPHGPELVPDQDQEQDQEQRRSILIGAVETHAELTRLLVRKARTTAQVALAPPALLHGGLSEADKSAVMAGLASGSITTCVATTVIEVGIDLPGLALLLIIDADRFGLAQLHQLRGRLGRGTLPGICVLLHDGQEPNPRLQLLATCNDGLRLAEADLAERGPGALLGTAQHGVLRLRAGDLARDLDLLQDAHAEASARLRSGATMPPALRELAPGDGGLLAGG